MTDSDGLIDREVVISRLRRERPRRHFLRTSLLAFAALSLYAWTAGGVVTGDDFSPRRLANVQRFLGELRPHPLHGRAWSSATALEWAGELLATRAGPAALTTLAMSIVAITLAGCAALALGLPASRAVACPEPYLPDGRPPGAVRRQAWRATVGFTRALLILMRAVPEYIWAFLALAVIGPNVWAAVFALAIHNAGILGKLDAEVIENLDPGPMAANRAAGASRLQIALAGIRPGILARVLVLFFYRWETCVREATVLGMLGIVSLGFFVQDARARQQYDVVLALILVGGLLVLIGDAVSAAARAIVRRAR